MEERSPLDDGVGMHFVEVHPLPAPDIDWPSARCTLGDIFALVLHKQQIQHFDG
jgi:hypothetical protein